MFFEKSAIFLDFLGVLQQLSEHLTKIQYFEIVWLHLTNDSKHVLFPKNHVWNSSFTSRITFFKKVEIFRFSKKWFLKIIQKVPFFRGTCTNNSLEAKSMASFFRFASTNQHFELFLWWKKSDYVSLRFVKLFCKAILLYKEMFIFGKSWFFRSKKSVSLQK